MLRIETKKLTKNLIQTLFPLTIMSSRHTLMEMLAAESCENAYDSYLFWSGMGAWLWSVKHKKETWMGWPPREVVVAYVDDCMVGWCGLGMFRCKGEWASSIYVRREHRGRGIARKMTQMALKIPSPKDEIYFQEESINLKEVIEEAKMVPINLFSVFGFLETVASEINYQKVG